MEKEEILFGPDARVTRKNTTKDPHLKGINGTVVSNKEGNRCYIKWDVKADNGQQHSTIKDRFLRAVLPEEEKTD